ncbi:MAG TPA: tRNA (adenosine(37)-N6)-threonylcarbamoyltransferase complex ATPase subunit type 1 TsaE [Candidatus Limnocylindrales bacterium]
MARSSSSLGALAGRARQVPGTAARPPDAPAREILVADAEAMGALGATLAALARPGDLLCLFGDLGAGKTVLAKGFAAGLGVTDTVTSPSFVLMAEYGGRLPLFHIDLYRLADGAAAISGGLLDERQAEGVTLIEWADRLGAALPASRLDVHIDGTGDDARTVRLAPTDGRHGRYVEAVP